MFRALFERWEEPLEIRDEAGRCVARNPAAERLQVPYEVAREALHTGRAALDRDGRWLVRAIPLGDGHTALRVVPEPDLDRDELDRLVGRMAHDLTEPLRLITMYAQLLDRELRDALDETARHHFRIVLDNVARIQRAIDDLLELSRIGRLGAVEEEVPLHPLVSEVVAALGDEARDAHVVWEDLPVVHGSSALLRRVFARLIDNALLFRGDAPPEIHITARVEGGRAHVEVRDNGIGIDPAHHEAIFEPFTRLHAYEKRPGTGVGLTFCRRAAERMGGSLRVESAPGQGSRFTVELRAA